MADLAGSIALVTGAASGIGAATALRLAAGGAAGLVLVDRDADGLARLAGRLSGCSVMRQVLDVAEAAAWEALEAAVAERFGGLDHVVVNAGVADSGAIVDYDFDRWRVLMATNLDGAFLTLKHGMRLIHRRGRGGAIVAVASAAALKAEAGAAAYAASKAAVVQLVRAAAKEGAPDRVRVNAIAPGGVETPLWHDMPFFQELVTETGSRSAAFDAMAATGTPLGRFATADEIAAQILHLLSPASAMITGAVLVIDGGYVL